MLRRLGFLDPKNNPPPSSYPSIPFARMRKAILIALGVIGVSLIALAIPRIWFQFHSTSWPKTTASILDSDFFGKDIRISYKYEVAGQSYTSDRYSFSPSRSYDPAQRTHLSAIHSKNGTVEIFYNPGDPGFSVVNPSYGKRDAAGLALALGLAFIATSFIELRKPKTSPKRRKARRP